ncbi:MAG: VOC family protein [Candidatus Margulisiibacteriota bacterium]
MSNTVAKNPVGWFEIYVEDMARAKRFYEGVFKVSFDRIGESDAGIPGFEMWSFPADMNLYGAGGALVKMPGMSAGKNSVLVYFSCDDCVVEESRIQANGGKVEKTKFSIGQYGFISIVFDSEGNMFGLHSLK